MNLYKKFQEDFLTYQPNWGNIKISGADVVNFLQGQTSNDVDVPLYSGQLSTLLDAKARILALLFVYRVKEDEYFILAPNRSNEWLQEHFEKFIIMEEVNCDKNSYYPYLVNGIKSLQYLKQTYKSITRLDYNLGQEFKGDFICRTSFIGGEGYLVFSEKKSLFCKYRMDDDLFNVLRLERGIPFYANEFDETNLLPEIGLQARVVNYNKGCFIGQEIVARVKSRGNINRALVGLVIETGEINKGDLYLAENKIGKVVNFVFSPYFNKYIAYAYLNKKVREKDGSLDVQQDDNKVKVSLYKLPFVTDDNLVLEAKQLFIEAMALFSQEGREAEEKAISLLRQAIMKCPKYADAYESLGVILSRHEQYDEAIELMKQLKELNPREVMAYSNLSVFYMKKGMIEEAEEEKAQATLVTFYKAADERKKRLSEDAIQQQSKDEIKSKMVMFQEVLELDSDDLLANYSLGKSYLDLGEVKESLFYLEKAIKIKKNYSVGYLQLGKCLKSLGRLDEAKDVWNKGIRIANDNGDLMTAKEMTVLLVG